VTRDADVDGARLHRGGPLDRRDRQQLAPVARGVAGHLDAVEHGLQVPGELAVRVEAEHRVGLGQLGGELAAVALGEAAHRNDLRAGVRGGEQRVDGVLLGRLHETAGVDDDDVRGVVVLHQLPAGGVETAGQLLGVDLVTGAPEGDEGDAAAGGDHPVESRRGRCRRRCT
jgi:hypothetical protein